MFSSWWIFLGLLSIGGDVLANEDSLQLPFASTVQDIFTLGKTAKNLTVQMKELRDKLQSNVTNIFNILNKGPIEMYKWLVELIPEDKHCIPLKNSLTLISSHFSHVMSDCYNRSQKVINSLLDSSGSVTDIVIEEVTKWSNTTSQFTSPLSLLTTSASTAQTLLPIDTNAIYMKTRIEAIKMLLERFDVAQKLKELESDLNAKFCAAVVISYAEEIKNLMNSFKKCLRMEGLPALSNGTNLIDEVRSILPAITDTTSIVTPEITSAVTPEITSAVTPETTSAVTPETTSAVTPETTSAVTPETKTTTEKSIILPIRNPLPGLNKYFRF